VSLKKTLVFPTLVGVVHASFPWGVSQPVVFPTLVGVVQPTDW